ncbi:MAG: FAD binding domain-containing protein [Bhargavaea sp.]
MIGFNFEYHQPATVQDAMACCTDCSQSGKKTIFYSGGTEFLTLARVNEMAADAVIDIKGIPDCNVLRDDGEKITIGAAVSLNRLARADLFPLLSEAVRHIADHTSRNKITIGGNVNSRLMYREGLLPLLLADAEARIAGPSGERLCRLSEIVGDGKSIPREELLLQIMVDREAVERPYVFLKKTRMTKVGYPVVSVAANVENERISAAFSGLCRHPFRSEEVDRILNDPSLPDAAKVNAITGHLPTEVMDDMHASAEYRLFVLKNMLRLLTAELEVNR